MQAAPCVRRRAPSGRLLRMKGFGAAMQKHLLILSKRSASKDAGWVCASLAQHLGLGEPVERFAEALFRGGEAEAEVAFAGVAERDAGRHAHLGPGDDLPRELEAIGAAVDPREGIEGALRRFDGDPRKPRETLHEEV